MSFSSEVKAELAKQIDSKRHCQLAELAAIETFAADHTHLAEKRRILAKKLFGDIPAEQLQQQIDRTLHAQREQLLSRNCCKRAFLRGAFLASGSISDPQKSYHFEIVCQEEAQARLLQQLYRTFELDAKVVQRKKYYIVYLKEGAQIVDALNVMGAYVALMNLENVRIFKEMRGSVNRIVNCETANINKVVGAACRQVEDIHYIQSKMGLDELPPALREMALIRLEYPDSSLKELGELCDPPVGKSGVNHRLRKLGELAEKLRNCSEQIGAEPRRS
ncbi:MAG: DNA-binding protein WhiA [Lachnospiraceae bacterium]|nr:DNA-binding protein WhiA [Lachnospiraceae bacterium]